MTSPPRSPCRSSSLASRLCRGRGAAVEVVGQEKFEAARIGTLTLKNRIVMPPMLMGYGTAEGHVTQRMKDYLEERARGGVGMVIVEAVGVRMEGRVFPCSINCYDETHLPGLTELAAVIK